jgi:hypothetical protein
MASQTNGSAAVAPRSPPSYSATWPTGTEYSEPPAFRRQLPSFSSSGTDSGPPAGPPTSQPGYPSLSYKPHNPTSPGPLNNDFLDSLQPGTSPRTSGERNGSIHIGRDEEGVNHANSDVDFSTNMGFPSFQTGSHNHNGQWYVDLTAVPASDGSIDAPSSSSTLHDPTVTAIQGAKASEDISEALATNLAEFSSAVFHSQAEIAGMSLAVAEYIAWMRKVPAGITPPNTSLVYVNVLEAVEGRLREIREIAQTKPHAAFREMVAALQGLGSAGSSVCNSLGDLEGEFQRRSADVASYFQTRYNACALLSEQAQNVPHGAAMRKTPPGLPISGSD